MALSLGDTAPNFDADTTEGRINLHEWLGDSWAVLFSHPRAFTPVCTTELGYMASIKPEFDKRGVKIIAISVDPVANNENWSKDIEETQGTAPNYPIISDAEFTVSKAYGMLPADVEGDPSSRTAAQNQTVRNVFVIAPDKTVKLILVYPMTTGRNFDEVLRVIDSLQLTAKHKVATPAQWQQGQDVIIAGSVSDDRRARTYRTAGSRRSRTSGSSRSPRASDALATPRAACRSAPRRSPSGSHETTKGSRCCSATRTSRPIGAPMVPRGTSGRTARTSSC